MSKGQQHIVPELRFPEFENDGEWEGKLFGEIGEIIGGGTPSTNLTEYWGGDINWFTPSELKNKYLGNSNRTITAEGLKKSSAKILPQGTLLISTRATVGEVSIATVACSTNQGFQSLVVHNSEINEFWYYWILKNKMEFVKRSSGSTFPEISKAKVLKIPVHRPKKKEQQKIAACLSSLDELITAETQKLESLKDHKKGLLQILFPADGETIPQLRFPEFEKDGEWIQHELGSVTSYFKGFAFRSADYTEKGRRIIRVSDMGYDYIKDDEKAIYIEERNASEYKKWQLKEQDLILTTVGSKPPIYDSLVGRSIVVKNKDKGSLLNQNAVCLRAKGDMDQKFLNFFFKSDGYIKFIESIIRGNANQGSIALENLFRFKLNVPTIKEQQKIAACLSSLDEQINDQSLRIDELKAHKKGLMQQMFPVVNE